MNIFISGANRGLGYALTKVGLEKGYTIFAGTRSASQAELLVKLKQNYPERLYIIEIDVTDESSVIRATNHIREKTKSLDCIINNAGILLEREKTIEELDLEATMKTFNVNVFGPIRVIKHLLPLLRNGEQQTILNISSEAGSITKAYSGDYPYGLSKVALNMLSEKLKVYLREDHIQVVSVHPGWMKTDMGGEQAPVDPFDTANGIYKIADRTVKIEEPHVFVDYLGKRMAI